MAEWRLILGRCPADLCMAIDEALMYSKAMGAPNTVRLYVFDPTAVTIGYFQRIADSVNLEEAERLGISVVRRISGGGSVLHDARGEVTYSVVVGEEDVPGDVEESFRHLSGGVVEALRLMGLPAEFVPINDIVVRSKKISGNAQARRPGVVLQHGTLLYNADLELMARILKAPRAKLETHGAASIAERVTTVSRELGRTVTAGEVVEALRRGFEKHFGVELVEGQLTPLEYSLASSLRWKYRSREWNYLR